MHNCWRSYPSYFLIFLPGWPPHLPMAKESTTFSGLPRKVIRFQIAPFVPVGEGPLLSRYFLKTALLVVSGSRVQDLHVGMPWRLGCTHRLHIYLFVLLGARRPCGCTEAKRAPRTGGGQIEIRDCHHTLSKPP